MLFVVRYAEINISKIQFESNSQLMPQLFSKDNAEINISKIQFESNSQPMFIFLFVF
jgi:ribosomal protein L18E